MKLLNSLMLLCILNCGCAMYKIQNPSQKSYVCEFQISGIPTSTYNNDLLPRLNRLLKRENLQSANDSVEQQKDIYTFKFFLKNENLTNISTFVGYYKIFVYEVFESGGNFNLTIFNSQDKNKIMIYQYSKESKINLFSTQISWLLLFRKHYYKIK